jgi:hypothetical protein
VLASAVVACSLTAVGAAPAMADLNPGQIQLWPTSGTRICDAYSNYVAVDANAETLGQGTYEFRYTIMKDGANRYYSPMQGPWALLAWKWYAMGAWNGYLDIPSGAGLRAWLFKWNGSSWETKAYKTVPCFTPVP